MDLGLSGKVALVTAASKGLGKGIALQLAQEGAEVVINSRSQEALEAAAREIAQASGREPLVVAGSVSDAATAERLVAAATERFGRIDILVNNAGGPPSGMFDDMTDEQWKQAVDLLLLSTVRLTRAVLPGMRGRQWGRIINSTSISVKQPITGLLLSNSVRTAVIGLAKTLSQEVARDGVTINNLLPGSIYTDRIEQLNTATAKRTGKTAAEVRQAAEDDIPVGRYGKVKEYAAAAAFLASEQASYITGVSLLVDGGVYRGLM